MRKEIVFALGATLGLGACAGGASAPGAEASSGGDMALYGGPIASQDVAQGKELFDSFCGDCHPGGGADNGPSLVEDPHSPPKIRKKVREGGSRMRRFPEARLSPAQLEAILAYLDTLGAVTK